MHKKHYLVTGGTGFIGAALVKRLIISGAKVRVFDNGFRSNFNRLESIKNNIEFIQGDIRDMTAVNNAVHGVDAVIHLAAINGTAHFYTQPELVLDVGVKGILNILDACKNHNVSELIVASSSEAYQSPTIVPTPENVPLVIPDPLNPRYSYGASKIISEMLAINYGRDSRFKKVVIFRPHNVYGPDMAYEHVLPQFIMKAAEAVKKYPTGPVPFQIQGSGDETRAFIYIDDFIDGLMLILEKGRHLTIYNIGNPEELTIAEVAKNVLGLWKREIDIQSGELQPGSTLKRCPDITKIHQLGFSPKISFNEGLPKIAEWYIKMIEQRTITI